MLAAAGLVNNAASGVDVEPFCTVTTREAEADRFCASVTVSPSVRPPLAALVVFQANEALVPLVVVEKTWVPSTVRR